MKVQIKGAQENNLKNVDLEIGNGLTVVTGVSGSGKTSLIFDTLYHEAKRRFQEVFTFGSPSARLSPAKVDSITGLSPAIAVGQNILNRNPNSTLATASGLHPFLRILFSRFSQRICRICGSKLAYFTIDEIIEKIVTIAQNDNLRISAPIINKVEGSHKTLLKLLSKEFGVKNIIIDDIRGNKEIFDVDKPHTIKVEVAEIDAKSSINKVREAIHTVSALGSHSINIEGSETKKTFTLSQVCSECGTWFNELRPTFYNQNCPYCDGEGCDECNYTGLPPEAAFTTWAGNNFQEIQRLNVEELLEIFNNVEILSTNKRLINEIKKRLEALKKVGLGYVSLNRSSPTLSRGESQRVRLAISLTSRLDDILHVLDEPTIGQHTIDVLKLMPEFRKLSGPVVYIEHDRLASTYADHTVDIGPNAGEDGGKIVFTGTASELWDTDTHTGRYFSLKDRVEIPDRRKKPTSFISIKGAFEHNLKNIDVKIPKERLTVITGVSGSGKSTLVEDVIASSFKNRKPIGCSSIEGKIPKVVMVDQSPIGKNPRSNPATYTKLSDIIRRLFSEKTGLSASHFSFNRPEGACSTCKGMGAVEVKMRYLPSTWITCLDCEGKRFNDVVLKSKINFGEDELSIADFYKLSIGKVGDILKKPNMKKKDYNAAKKILRALNDIGLGYISLGQPSPTLSGGEAQRVKLAKYLGRKKLTDYVLILDEPSTGLHPKDLIGLLKVLDRLVKAGTTIIVVEHNLDIIRAADWVIDLGPGAGPNGGNVVYMGNLEGLMEFEDSLTSKALKIEEKIKPSELTESEATENKIISIRGAKANNLKNINVEIPKGKLTVITGVSGSGKSSLVTNILEAESNRRFLETLSLYERQSVKEGPEAEVDSISGLGVSVTVTPDRKLYSRRSTVGTATEIWHHLAILFSSIGVRTCLECNTVMEPGEEWKCPECGSTAHVPSPRMFDPSNYAAACTRCNGVGSLQVPRPDKLIRHPEKPICGGAMYSPGFFPKGYLCKPGNGGYDIIQALAQRYNFDPMMTPWNEMTEGSQQAFLFGDLEPMEVTFRSRTGRTYSRTLTYKGFYGWSGDWDVGGTYTDTVVCPECDGARLRQEYLAVKINGNNIHQLNEKPLEELQKIIEGFKIKETNPIYQSYYSIKKRIRFLNQVGLGYINLNRISASLSAGEAQRVKLAGLLGSGLTNLTILLDEPTRGLHPSEVNALVNTLKELRDDGNTVLVVEHDLELIKKADHIIDFGPGPGIRGGRIVAIGSPEKLTGKHSVTSKWLKETRKTRVRKRRTPNRWLTIEGARENNLKGDTVKIPVDVLVGVCGVSGSGKSTLLVDTIGRILAPKNQTTSVAKEPIEPGKYNSIKGTPNRTIIMDQTKKGIRSPARFLAIDKQLLKLYAASEDAQTLGVDISKLREQCSVCNGTGLIRTKLEFLPDVFTECESCRGTGFNPEAWKIKLNGYSLPELYSLTIEEVYKLFENTEISNKLEAAKDVGLGYLVLKQPSYSLSGGEAQRLKIAKELCRKKRKGTLYILDEPTLGQHMEDVERLVKVLHRVVDEGNGVIVIEHHPYVLASCDWILELGPEGGPKGGNIIAKGIPEDIVEYETSTSPYIKEVLRNSY